MLPGDAVRVASRKEIDETLDPWGAVNGCVFLREMDRYCGGTYKVLKTAEYFYDEKKGRLVRCRDLVILDGLVCGGERRLFREPCDLVLLSFWHARGSGSRKPNGPMNACRIAYTYSEMDFMERWCRNVLIPLSRTILQSSCPLKTDGNFWFATSSPVFWLRPSRQTKSAGITRHGGGVTAVFRIIGNVAYRHIG